MQSESSGVLTLGPLSLDHLIGEEFEQKEAIGGGSLYAGIAAGIKTKPVNIVTSVCQDFPVEQLQALAPESVSLDAVTILGDQRRSTIEYDVETSDSDRVSHAFTDEEWVRQSRAQAPRQVPARTAGIDAVHLSPMMPDNLTLYAQWATEHNLTVTLDLSEYYVINHLSAVIEVLEYVDVFLPSDIEAEHILPEYDGQRADLAAIADYGPNAVVVKQGPEGCLAYDDEDESLYQCPTIASEVVDPTGAGDSFDGGFIATYPQTDIAKACKYGTALAARCIRGVGTTTLAQTTQSEVDRLADSVNIEQIH